jgi:ribosome biogenesis GTPase / thiamine phosphate phosphatase
LSASLFSAKALEAFTRLHFLADLKKPGHHTMIQFDFERLRSLGLTFALAQQATLISASVEDANLQLMRLTEVHRDSVRLHDGVLTRHAHISTKLSRRLMDEDSELAVGDWVLAAAPTEAIPTHRVHERVPPQTHLVRRDADGRRHAVVSNVDTALLVMGLDDDFNLRRLERYIALVQGTGVVPVIVLTKADVVLDARSLYERQHAVRERMVSEWEIFCVDARDADTAARLSHLARAGQTLVLLGSSGAGKSTLTNTLLSRQANEEGAHQQDTGPVRAHDSRGKHTTTARSLFQLPSGACVIDTPRLRALRPDAGAGMVAATFADIAALAPQCRFRNCAHTSEPGCVVREGVDADRLQNYQKLLREARRDTMSVLERQQQLATWKARGRAGKAREKMKRGEA